MKRVNIGCGLVFHPDWMNIDIEPVSSEVIKYDARRPLPFNAGEFDVVYCSHLLEHLSRTEATVFLNDCRRILKADGIIRMVVPDLENISRLYLKELEQVRAGEGDVLYEWLRLELTDQLTREVSGGEMLRYVRTLSTDRHEIIKARVGTEFDHYIEMSRPRARFSLGKALRRLQYLAAKLGLFGLGGARLVRAFEAGVFRHSGEVHRIMYDDYSLGKLLSEVGFREPRRMGPFESRIGGFDSYELDSIGGMVRKPDSLYMEAVR